MWQKHRKQELLMMMCCWAFLVFMRAFVEAFLPCCCSFQGLFFGPRAFVEKREEAESRGGGGNKSKQRRRVKPPESSIISATVLRSFGGMIWDRAAKVSCWCSSFLSSSFEYRSEEVDNEDGDGNSVVAVIYDTLVGMQAEFRRAEISGFLMRVFWTLLLLNLAAVLSSRREEFNRMGHSPKYFCDAMITATIFVP